MWENVGAQVIEDTEDMVCLYQLSETSYGKIWIDAEFLPKITENWNMEILSHWKDWKS